MPTLTIEQAALAAEIRKAERARTKARRYRDLVASKALDDEPNATLAVVASAAIAAARAERAVSAARAAFLATIHP